jgi:hypothetical protein
MGVNMRARGRSSVAACLTAVTLASTAFALPPQPPRPDPPPVSHEVHLTAAPALGAIPLAFVRNQFEYCSLICPYALQGAITIPIGVAQAPAVFLGSLASTGSPLRAIGAAAASVTGPASAAITPLINNDVYLVVPKAFHALGVAVVEVINIGAAVFAPGQFLQAVQGARTNILGALNQPVGPPTTPSGARNILQVVAVETINVTAAVAFQAGELLLAGVVQVADAAAQELARSGDPAAALTAGAEQAGRTVNEASNLVVTAVDTAVTNISNSLRDPFPSTPQAVAPKQRPADSTRQRLADRRTADGDQESIDPDVSTDVDVSTDADASPEVKKAETGGSANADHSGASSNVSGSSTRFGSSTVSSTISDRLTRCCSNDNATPSARKNRMNNGAPR